MTITCKKCGARKHPVLYRPCDIRRETHICRSCRGTLGNSKISPGQVITSWRTSNGVFFAEGRVRP